MNILDQLSDIRMSKTIQPSFQLVHVLLGLFVFKQQPQGIGRYRLEVELSLSEGKVRSLLKHMKRMQLVKVDDNMNGHMLSERGEQILREVDKILTPPLEPKFDISQIVIGECVRYSIVYNGINHIESGMEQRDEAIKVGGSGATCLIMKNGIFHFPSTSLNQGKSISVAINAKSLEFPFTDADVLVLGTGKSLYLSNLATIAAALSLING